MACIIANCMHIFNIIDRDNSLSVLVILTGQNNERLSNLDLVSAIFNAISFLLVYWILCIEFLEYEFIGTTILSLHSEYIVSALDLNNIKADDIGINCSDQRIRSYTFYLMDLQELIAS